MIAKFWINSSLHVSFCAASISLASAHFLSAKNSWVFFVFALLGTWSVYLSQRIFKGRRNGITKVQEHILEHKKVYAPLAAVLAVFAAAFAAILDFYFLLLAGTGFILSLSYVFFPRKKKGFRNSPWLKVGLIALVWTLVTAIIPAYKHMQDLDAIGYSLFVLERFLFIVMITLPFDIRDLLRDAPNQNTVPLLIGMRNTKILMSGIFVGILAILFHLQLEGFYELTYAGIMAGVYSISYLLSVFAKEGLNERYFTFWIESTMLIVAIPMLFFESYF